jgi:hypothetical protein
MLTFALGVYAVLGNVLIDAAAAVAAAGLLASREQLHGWVKKIVRLQMFLDNVGGVGTEALARLGLEFKRLSSGVAIVAA